MNVAAVERDFIRESVYAGCREDGRGKLDFRPFTLETGLMVQASGSSRLRRCGTGAGGDILVGAKMEVGDLLTVQECKTLTGGAAERQRGRVVCSVETSPSAAYKMDETSTDLSGTEQSTSGNQLNLELAGAVERVLNDPAILPLKDWLIIPDQSCWVLYIDAVILEYGSSLMDLLFLAIYAALYNTRIPKLDMETLPSGELAYEVSDDLSQAIAIDLKHMPIALTFHLIGNDFVVDPTSTELLCTDCSMTFFVTLKTGQLVSMQKGFQGAIEPPTIAHMINSAKKIIPLVTKSLLDCLERESVLDKAFAPKTGFFVSRQHDAMRT